MTEVRYQIISEEEAGQRLDNYLIRCLKGVPKSCVYRIIRSGEVRVNKKRADAATRLVAGDAIRIPPLRLSEKQEVYVGEDLQQFLRQCLIHEDAQLLVVNKPAGMAVHGGSGLSLGVIEALRKIRTDLSYLELVHRLDKDTSGCLLLAKKRSALRDVQTLFRERLVTKTYWALLAHHWQGAVSQEIDAPLLKNTLQSGERIVRVDSLGKPSLTQFKLLENFAESCLVQAKPKTGRTHQIRVHAAFLGHPVVGDDKYGDKGVSPELSKLTTRLYLHAHALQFTLKDTRHHYKAPLDARFTKILECLRPPER